MPSSFPCSPVIRECLWKKQGRKRVAFKCLPHWNVVTEAKHYEFILSCEKKKK